MWTEGSRGRLRESSLRARTCCLSEVACLRRYVQHGQQRDTLSSWGGQAAFLRRDQCWGDWIHQANRLEGKGDRESLYCPRLKVLLVNCLRASCPCRRGSTIARIEIEPASREVPGCGYQHPLATTTREFYKSLPNEIDFGTTCTRSTSLC